jgi:hypothetical protein
MSTIIVRYNKQETHNLKFWPNVGKDTNERLYLNTLNAAVRAAANTGIQISYGQLYSHALLKKITEEVSTNEQLSVDGRKSPYLGSSGEIVRNILILKSQGEAYEIAFYDVKIKVSQTKTIKETALTGRTGTIKEYIQAKDYVVQVKGSIISDNPCGFPISQLGDVVDLMKKPESMEAASIYLQAFGITKLVLKNADYDQQNANYINTLPFVFTFVSDEDYELQVE